VSRAFVKEGDGEDALPDLPLSPHPNYTTSAGREAMATRLQRVQAGLSAALADQAAGRVPPDGLSAAHWRREVRWAEARLGSAIVVPSPVATPQRVTFGVTVELEDEDGRAWHFRLVGEDEADPERGKLSWVSPLAKALLGASPGDEVPWPRPGGVVMATVVALRTC
jgi:transcription elongation GreA/GreB family factor